MLKVLFLDRSKRRGRSIQITFFLDQFSTIRLRVSFPFKYKFLSFLVIERAVVVSELFIPFPFSVFFPRKSHSSLQENFSNGFSKKKNGLISLNIHLSFILVWVKTHFLLDGASRRRPRSSLGKTPSMFLKMKAWWRGEKVLVK